MPQSVAIIIPARYASKRFPGKPLAEINGKSLIHHTIQAGEKAIKTIENCLGIFVATDSEIIANHVNTLSSSATVIMTSESCENGTERTAEALRQLQNQSISPDIVINLQGDSLLTPPRFIEALVRIMRADTTISVATPALQCDLKTLTMFQEDATAGRVGGTTIALSKSNQALYFSKSIIPYVDPDTQFNSDADIPVYHHVGLYAYTPKALSHYGALSIGRCERHEKLEQLRFLENDIPIRAVIVEGLGEVFWEVNNPEDISRVAPYLG